MGSAVAPAAAETKEDTEVGMEVAVRERPVHLPCKRVATSVKTNILTPD